MRARRRARDLAALAHEVCLVCIRTSRGGLSDGAAADGSTDRQKAQRAVAASLAALPRFPALRELLPMDVTDAGFRHLGQRHQLERLWCMYCRDTTDVATEHIAGLSKLRTYYADQTKITDRSLHILGRMPSLEKLEFWNCAGITNAGAALLAQLPRLQEVSFDDCRHITGEAATAFPPQVRVHVS